MTKTSRTSLLIFLAVVLLTPLLYLALHLPKNHIDKRNLLILGCARSGTTYITKVLKKSGLRIGHERMKRDGVCSWEMVVDTPTVPWGEARNGCQFAHIFHQVRDPLKTISSVYYSEPARVWDFIGEHLPEIKPEDPLLVKCAKYWYYWNLKAEAQAEWTYRIEDIDHAWNELGSRLGKDLKKVALKKVPKNVNTRKEHPTFTWKDLEEGLDPELYDKVRKLADKYGYLPR